MAKQETSGGGVGFCAVLFLIFLILKLTDTIDWSWWWVTSPIWIPIAVVLLIMLISSIISELD